MTATSDVVTPNDLPYQAKSALCNYVPQLHGTYDAQELDDDYPVRLTNQAAEYDHTGHRSGDEFRCQNDECWVSEYHADTNAGVTIADRHDPWGESLPLKPPGDDISRDGSACDSAATPTEQSQPRQMTLGEVGSEPAAGSQPVFPCREAAPSSGYARLPEGASLPPCLRRGGCHRAVLTCV